MSQKVDLIELQLTVFRRVERDTMIQREWNSATLKESDEIVQVLAPKILIVTVRL